MPYTERVVVAGKIRETKKMYTGRVHTHGAARGPRQGKTREAQEKVNDRRAEEELRWKLNANFGAGDLHLVLHYCDKPQDLQKAEADKQRFLRLLRGAVKKQGLPWKYIACTESKRMTNIHHHIILPQMDLETLRVLWEKTAGGNISVRPMDNRGNHAKLANYLMKETRETIRRWRELGKRYKRFSAAQGMESPKPEYRTIYAGRWNEQPKARKGWALWKDEDGQTVRTGWHELTGWPWMEYTEIWTGGGRPPGRKQ